MATAKMLVSQGHHVLLHGRNPAKLVEAESMLSELNNGGDIESYVADLSRLADVEILAQAVMEKHSRLDVLINNAGVFRMADPITQDGLDARFMVNTIAPYLLMQRLIPLLGASGRIVNLSSAAQAPVDLEALAGRITVTDEINVYAQSKLALTMCSRNLGLSLKDSGPMIVAVNPGSLLGSKMVTEGFGIDGGDINIGADVLCRASLSDDFSASSGEYFDNDSGQFASPHSDALDARKCEKVIGAIEEVLASL